MKSKGKLERGLIARIKRGDDIASIRKWFLQELAKTEFRPLPALLRHPVRKATPDLGCGSPSRTNSGIAANAGPPEIKLRILVSDWGPISNSNSYSMEKPL